MQPRSNDAEDNENARPICPGERPMLQLVLALPSQRGVSSLWADSWIELKSYEFQHVPVFGLLLNITVAVRVALRFFELQSTCFHSAQRYLV